MKTQIKILNFLFIIVLAISSCSNNDDIVVQEPEIGIAGDGNLTEILEYVREANNIPAIAAMTFKDGVILEMAVAGTTKSGGSENVDTNAKWHLGSITKSMTSTLAGVMVENGLINWNSTIVDVFPEYSTVINAEYHDIKLEELLTHTSGIGEIDLDQWYESTDDMVVQRIEVAGEALTTDYSITRGEFSYSNTAYVTAAAMLEKVGGKSWEELLTENVFTPLGMNNSGFLAPTDSGSPWGHSPDGNATPLDPNELISDNPRVLGPAGTVHTTLTDMAKYINLHLDKGQTLNLLTPATFNKLHTGVVDMNYNGLLYALGWNVNSDASVMFHAGSNLRWLAELTLVQEKNVGIFVVMNMTGDGASTALTKATDYLIQREDAL